MKFLDSTTNETIDATEEQAPSLFSDPRYTPIGLQKYTLKDDEGGLWDFDDLNKAREASAKTGAQFITPFEDKKQEWEKSGITGDALAAGLGAASTATFGLSDVLGRALGREEDIRAIKEASPVAATVGEVAGAFVPSPIGVGALATKAGMKVGAKVAEAGFKTGKLAVKLGQKEVGIMLAEAGEGAASKIAASAARGAVAGGQQAVSQVALADTPVLSAQSAATVAQNVLLGAGLDAVFPIAGAVGGKAARMLIPGVAKESDTVANTLFAKGAAVFSGEDEKVIKTFMSREQRNYLNDIRDNLKEWTPIYKEELTKNIEGMKGNIAESYKRLRTTHEDLQGDWFGLERRAALELELSEAVKQKQLPAGVRKNIARARDILQNEESDTKAVQETMSVLKSVRRSMDLPVRDSESAILLEKDKKILDNLVNYLTTKRAEAAPKASEQWSYLDQMYAAQKRGEKLLKSLKTDETMMRGVKNGKLAAELKGYMDEFEKAEKGFWAGSEGPTGINIQQAQAMLAKLKDYGNFMRAAKSEKGPGIGTFGVGVVFNIPIAAAAATLSNPAKYLQMLDKVVSFGGDAVKVMDDVSKKQWFPSLLRASPTLVSDEVGLAVAEALRNKQGYENHVAALTSPESQAKVSETTSQLARLHPDLPMNAAARVASIQNYLAAELPKARTTLNGRRQVLPTDKELSSYAKKLTIALDPIGTITRLGVNGLTTTHLNALQATYPELHALVMEATQANGAVDLSGAQIYQDMHNQGVSGEPPNKQKKINLNVTIPKTNTQRAEER